MHIGVLPDSLLERMALTLGLMPTPLGETFWGMGTARCLIAGLRLGVFEALASGQKSGDVLARELECDPQGLRVLLTALCGFGYLHRGENTWRLTSQSRKWLLKSSPRTIYDSLLFMGDVWRWLGPLEDAVRTGKVARIHDTPQPPDFWERYMRALASFARLGSKEIVRKIKVETQSPKLLDLGGGHGIYSAAFCKRHPTMMATVFDLPEAAAVGRTLVAREAGGDRVHYVEGDFRQGQFGEGYDLILMFNILHNATETEAKDLIRKAHASLSPGGQVAILEASHPKERGDLDAAAGFSELFFFLVSAAQAWPEATMTGWLKGAGYQNIQRHRLFMTPAVLLTAGRG